jgi:hypothetical protein
MLLVQHLVTTNDNNGNPRRLWAFYDPTTGDLVRLVDEGYTGRAALRNVEHVELPMLEITVGEYRSIRRYVATMPSIEYIPQ